MERDLSRGASKGIKDKFIGLIRRGEFSGIGSDKEKVDAIHEAAKLSRELANDVRKKSGQSSRLLAFSTKDLLEAPDQAEVAEDKYLAEIQKLIRKRWNIVDHERAVTVREISGSAISVLVMQSYGGDFNGSFSTRLGLVARRIFFVAIEENERLLHRKVDSAWKNDIASRIMKGNVEDEVLHFIDEPKWDDFQKD